jgi:hypothetical protein
VFYLNQKMSDEGKREAEQFTRELIDATLQYGGTYYLPYRRYATEAQIRKAYPQLDAFIQKKERCMPPTAFSIIRSSSITERRKSKAGQKKPRSSCA